MFARPLAALAGLLLIPLVVPPVAAEESGEIAARELPAWFLIGDSTVRNSTRGQQGWGTPLADLLDPSRVILRNQALGGRSSRTFLTEGLWDGVRAELREGDVLLIQFGHNDGGPMDSGRARASIKGNGEETVTVTIQETGVEETVRSYGAYLRHYISEAREAGARPIVLSPVPRNLWQDGRVARAAADYGRWAREAAEQAGADFIDLNELVASAYEAAGEERVRGGFFEDGDHTHTTPAGARFMAEILAAALAGLDLEARRDAAASHPSD